MSTTDKEAKLWHLRPRASRDERDNLQRATRELQSGQRAQIPQLEEIGMLYLNGMLQREGTVLDRESAGYAVVDHRHVFFFLKLYPGDVVSVICKHDFKPLHYDVVTDIAADMLAHFTDSLEIVEGAHASAPDVLKELDAKGRLGE